MAAAIHNKDTKLGLRRTGGLVELGLVTSPPIMDPTGARPRPSDKANLAFTWRSQVVEGPSDRPLVKCDIKASAGSGVGAAGVIPAMLLGAILPMPADAIEGSFRPGAANERAGSRWLLHFHKSSLMMLL